MKKQQQIQSLKALQKVIRAMTTQVKFMKSYKQELQYLKIQKF